MPYLPKLKILLAFAAVYFIWGTTFYGVKLSLLSFPPFLLSSLRLLIGGATLLLICVIKREPVPGASDIYKNAICGIVMFMGGMVAVVWAMQYISSSLASIIITTPFWFVVLDRKQWSLYFSSRWIVAGLITGLLGVILLLGFKEGRPGSGDEGMQILAILIMIAGSFFWAAGSLYLRNNPSKTTIYVNTSIQLLAAGIFCLGLSFLRGEVQNFSPGLVRTDSLIAILYLSWLSTLLTFMAFIWLIKVRPPAIVSTYSYVNPVVAVLLGWGLGGEAVTPLQIAALAIILCGVLLVNVPKYRQGS